MNTKIGIVGAGPAGVFAAISIAELLPGSDVTIFDCHEPLKTLLVTGGGRCNFFYFESDVRNFVAYYPRGGKFLLSIFFYDLNSICNSIVNNHSFPLFVFKL